MENDCYLLSGPYETCLKMQWWRDLGWCQDGQFIAIDLICSQIHTEREKPPEPHWYAAYNGKPEQTLTLKEWYDTIAHRWGIEPANRFRKERLYADLPKVRPSTVITASSDHWLMGVQLLEWELYLARDQVAQKVLPLQKPLAPADITPNRVIQSLPAHLSQLGTPAGEVRPRGNAPGWPTGVPKRYKLTPKRRKKALPLSMSA